MGSLTNMKLLVSLAILALAAAQNPAANIEEVVPENLAMNDDGSVADDFLVQSYNYAKEALAKGGEAGCKKLADDTEKAVRDAVEAEQKLINAMDNGGDCHTTGDSLVTAAENKLKQAQTAEQTAKKAKEKAEGQNISLGSRSFKQLESILSKGKCNKDIIMGSDYAGAVATVKAKRNAHTSAKGAITTAKGAVKDAKKEAATLANTCMCNLIKEHDAAVKATNKKNQDANKKAWTQAAHIRCVVDSVPMAKCKVGKPPVVVPAKLAAGVKCDPACKTTTYKTAQSFTKDWNMGRVNTYGKYGKCPKFSFFISGHQSFSSSRATKVLQGSGTAYLDFQDCYGSSGSIAEYNGKRVGGLLKLKRKTYTIPFKNGGKLSVAESHSLWKVWSLKICQD